MRPPLRGHPGHLSQSLDDVADVAQGKPHADRRKAPIVITVVKGEGKGVPLGPRDRRQLPRLFGGQGLGPAPGDGEHIFGEIEAGDRPSGAYPAGHEKREVARAAADIQRGLPGGEAGLPVKSDGATARAGRRS